MPMKPKTKTKRGPRKFLRLTDLDHAKRTVVNTLGSAASARAYTNAIDDFVDWYSSEPRLAFSKHVVLRYRLELESRHLAASTINLRLAAVRRLAYEAADTGILSPELAAGIQRVKGAKRLGVRLGNWLTVEECRAVLAAPDVTTLTGCRDRAMLSLLFGCGLRRAELVALELRDLQREGQAHSHRSRAGLGADCGGRVDHDSADHGGPFIPLRRTLRAHLGQRDHR